MKNLKKHWLMLVALVLLLTSVCHAQQVSVELDGKKLDFEVQPQIIQGSTMVPLRAIFEALGAKVDWDDPTKTVTSTKDNVTIKLTIGSNILYKNNQAVTLEVPAQILDGSTLVPVRAISESFGCNVDWIDSTKTVVIKTQTQVQTQTQVRTQIEGAKVGDVIHFEGSTTKSPLEYKAGETMTFKLCIKKGTTDVYAPYIYYKCIGDDGATTSGYVQQSDDGYYYFDTKCQRDGFVRVTARVCDGYKRIIPQFQIFEGGAGADIDKIKAATVEPDDYLKFWEDLKKVAFGLSNEIIYESENISTNSAYIAKDVRIKTAQGAGEYASFIYSYPKDAAPGTLRLKMYFQGYAVKGVSAPTYENGTIVVNMCTHDIPNRKSASYYNSLSNYKNYGYSVQENQNPKTSYWWKVFVRNMQVFNYFKNHKLFNGVDVSFSGSSQGAFQACNMAAHSGLATYCYMDVPWFGNIYGPSLDSRMSGTVPAPANGLRYFDTAIAAKYLTCRTEIRAGLGDYNCPPSTIMAMYNNMSCKKSLTFVQNKTHSYEQPRRVKSYTIGVR